VKASPDSRRAPESPPENTQGPGPSLEHTLSASGPDIEQFCTELAQAPPIYLIGMATNSTLLCIHRDPTQLSMLQESGYELVTATNGHEGLRLFMSRPVDAIVLEYHLGLLDGSVIAAEIKQVRPNVPIVLLADHVELPDGALKSVDAFVAKSDGPHFLVATVHFVLRVKPAQRLEGKLRAQTLAHLRRPGRSREGAERWPDNPAQLAIHEKDAPLSPRVWRSIRNGTVKF
jgi:CheY-like chemotaxis protein